MSDCQNIVKVNYIPQSFNDITMLDYCEKCGGAVRTFNRIEIFTDDDRDSGNLFYFVCGECTDRVMSFLETPNKALVREGQ